MRVNLRAHKDDAQSLFCKVKEISEKHDEILVFKPYQADVEIGPSAINDLPDSKNLFMLGIQIKTQASLLAQHCHKIVVVDETHCTNAYG